MAPTRPARPASSRTQLPDPVGTTVDRRPRPGAGPDGEIAKAFSVSVVVSGVRCLLAYVIFPWILPLLGVAKGMGPAVGLVVGLVAIGFNIASIRRFMRSGHRYRYLVATINVAVIGLLSVLVVRDVLDLAG